MHMFNLKYLYTALTFTATAVLLTACGSDSTPVTSRTATTPAVTSTTSSPPIYGPSAPARVTKVGVTETDFHISLSITKFTAGDYEFDVVNRGSHPHDFIIEGPGLDKQKIPVGAPLQPGESDSQSITLQSGIYEISCGVDSHKDRGMFLNITVT